jgi:hypothetical protein
MVNIVTCMIEILYISTLQNLSLENLAVVCAESLENESIIELNNKYCDDSRSLLISMPKTPISTIRAALRIYI